MKEGWKMVKLGEVAEISPSKSEVKKLGLNPSDNVSFLPMEDLTIGKTYVVPQKNRAFSEDLWNLILDCYCVCKT